MSRFVFRKIETGEELPYSTVSITRTIMVPQKVKSPLWDSEGNRLSKAQLAELGLVAVEYPDQSQEWKEWKSFTSMYEAFPEAIGRVEKYRDLMNQLDIPYSATTDQIEAAVREKISDRTAQEEMIARINAAMLDVKVNYQAWAIASGLEAYVGNDFTTWLHMPILIKYLPSSKPVEPEYRQPIELD